MPNRDYKSYFKISTSSKSGEFDIDHADESDEKFFHSSKEEISQSINLFDGFTPADMDYHELNDEDNNTVIFGICGGQQVVFTMLNKATKKMELIPERHKI